MDNELYHHGILGMKWGIRRYQNKDGSLTSAGAKRYNVDFSKSDRKIARDATKKLNRLDDDVSRNTRPLIKASRKKRKNDRAINNSKRILNELDSEANKMKQKGKLSDRKKKNIERTKELINKDIKKFESANKGISKQMKINELNVKASEKQINSLIKSLQKEQFTIRYSEVLKTGRSKVADILTLGNSFRDNVYGKQYKVYR